MDQPFVCGIVHQAVGCAGPLQGAGKVYCILVEHIISAGYQEGRRKISQARPLPRVQIGCKRTLPPIGAVQVPGHGEAHLVPAGGVEHPADKAQGPDLRFRCLNASGGRHSWTPLHGCEVGDEVGAGAVAHQENAAGLAAKVRGQPDCLVHGRRNIRIGVKDPVLRYQAIVRAIYQKPSAAQLGIEPAIVSLAAHSQAAAVDIQHHRQRPIRPLGPIDIHAVGRLGIRQVGDVPDLLHILWKGPSRLQFPADPVKLCPFVQEQPRNESHGVFLPNLTLLLS